MSLVDITPTATRKVGSHLIFYYGARPDHLQELCLGAEFSVIFIHTLKVVRFHVTLEAGHKAIRALHERPLTHEEINYFEWLGCAEV